MSLPINQIICGKSEEVMKGMPAGSVDAIVTDIPYGIGFMGKEWDTFVPEIVDRQKRRDTRTQKRRQLYGGRESDVPSGAMAAGRYDFSRNAEYQQWCRVWSKEALRIAKPGAFLLCFGGTRTYHRVTCGLEDAGWQIRDCMCWLYGSGFPKSHDISKAIDKAKGAEREVVGQDKSKIRRDNENNNVYSDHCGQTGIITAPATELAKLWDGYGTALKPAWEPIIVAMKPIEGTFAHNAEKHGVAGINIDKGRIGTTVETWPSSRNYSSKEMSRPGSTCASDAVTQKTGPAPQGRFPANVILDTEAAGMLDEQGGELQSGARKPTDKRIGGYGADRPRLVYGTYKQIPCDYPANSGGASRFFYCAKASRAERNAGLAGMEEKKSSKMGDGIKSCVGHPNPDAVGNTSSEDRKAQNHHPTVKPLKLMQYLCRLLKPPAGGVLLDPFCGSGTTLMAAVSEGWDYIGIEREPEYVTIAEKRVAWSRDRLAEKKTLFDGVEDE